MNKINTYISVSIVVLSAVFFSQSFDSEKLFASMSFAQNIPPVSQSLMNTEELLIQNGFEDNTSGEPPEEIVYFHGSDLTMTAPNNWDDLVLNPDIGKVKIQYQGGDVDERYARIIDDPTTTLDNKVLHYWLKEPNTGPSGRVQMNIYDIEPGAIDEFYISVRMYLHPSFQELIDGDIDFEWMTLFEFWNEGDFDNPPHAFRMFVSMDKRTETPGTPLYFDVEGETKDDGSWQPIWQVKDDSYPVPLGQWFTAEVYVKEGDKNSGRFYFAVTPDGGHKKVIADMHDFTHHPDEVDHDGFININPMKLYTSDDNLDFMATTGEVLQIYWDDFKFWKNKQPASAICPD